MHIQRQQLQEIERSLNEMITRAREYNKTLGMDSRKRRDLETDLARADRVLGEVQSMISQ